MVSFRRLINTEHVAKCLTQERIQNNILQELIFFPETEKEAKDSESQQT